MGRTAGRTRRVTETFAVPETALRLIDASTEELRVGEVLVTRTRAPILTPVPTPPAIAWEMWRLVKHQGMKPGRVARPPRVGLAPTFTSRHTEVKRYVGKVEKFLKTPFGLTFQTASWWDDWLATGAVDPRLAAERALLAAARSKLAASSRR